MKELKCTHCGADLSKLSSIYIVNEEHEYLYYDKEENVIQHWQSNTISQSSPMCSNCDKPLSDELIKDIEITY